MTELTPYQARSAEVESYSANIDIYTSLLATLDGNWDADLIQYKGMEGHAAVTACPLDRVERLAVLIQFEQVSNLIKTEMLERAKSAAILAIMTPDPVA